MLKIVFNDGKEIEASFSIQSGNIVTLGSLDENTSGFKVYRSADDMFLGDYSGYSTVYKKNESSIDCA